MAAKKINEQEIARFTDKAAWLPRLFLKAATGGVQGWRVGVLDNVVVTQYGLNGGKLQWTSEEVKDGKNLGKKNATTPAEQAVLKARQLFDKKIKEGYQEDFEKAARGEVELAGIEVMLAHPIEDKEKYVVFPAFIQPKMDGHRVCAVIKKGVVKLYSRTRKPIDTMPHIVQQLEEIFRGETLILDGEAYNHDLKKDFEKLTSVIKRDDVHEDHMVMQYHVYDVPHFDDDDNFTWKERTFDPFYAITSANKPNIKIVDTYTAQDRKELNRMHDQFVAEGYEGAMYRHPTMPYENGRSSSLLKVKIFKEKEFEVVGYVEGKGKFAGGIGSFVVQTEDGQKFNVAMNGTIESLEEYLVNFDSYFGRMLTVQYQKVSSYGVPIFPRGLRFREDL